MKRDWDIIREILLYAEGADERLSEVHAIELPGRDAYEVYYNCKLLIDAGLISGTHVMGDPPPTYVSGLTWHGHDFLDAIRDDNVWSKTKSAIAKQASSAPLEVVKAVAIKVMSTMFGV